MNADQGRMGWSGNIAKRFLTTEITPLLALVGLLLGLFAILVTPREEEPQIDVTMANVFIPFPGATAREVESLVSAQAERVLSEIDGIEHVYSVSRAGLSLLTVQFTVGEPRSEAILRLYDAIFSNSDWLPSNLGVGQPLIKPMGIDDVPILALTLWTEDPERGAGDLLRVAHTVEGELQRVPGTRDIYTIGGPDDVVRVLLDPARMAGHGIALGDLRIALLAANTAAAAGEVVADNREITVRVGTFLGNTNEIADLVVGVFNGAPVFLRDVAEVSRGPDQPRQYVRFVSGPAGTAPGTIAPAVTIVVAKKAGTNAVQVANQVIERFEQLRGTLVPDGVQMTITRNYGETADVKVKTLIKKLIFATISVVALVLVALGFREAVIVGIAVVVTLAVTLFASWAYGFTLNRVTLFALIFSIGILVDDAIVVVENIHRHLAAGGKRLVEAIPLAVDEVGGPTILATFAVIAAILPMAFVTGLMGPYMSPIPINASIGMLLSLLVAFIITPWLARVLLHRVEHTHPEDVGGTPIMMRIFRVVVGSFLTGRAARPLRWALGLGLLAMIAGSVALVATQDVVMKMLPFDNKSEFQVIVDLPEGSSLEQTARVLDELAVELGTVPEVTDMQLYSGTAAPINFNGLVRQYYLRSGANVGDIQVNLVDKALRERKSHEVAAAVRGPLQVIGARHGANVKVVEVPPGPPVLSPLVAEIYGPDYAGQVAVAKQVREMFLQTDEVVDVDDSVEHAAPEWRLVVDRTKAATLGVSQAAIVQAASAALRGEDMSYLHREGARYPVPIRVELAAADQGDLDRMLDLRLRSRSGVLVPLSELVRVEQAERELSIYHKDLLPVVYVTGDVSGRLDSPLYAMFDIYQRLGDEAVEGRLLEQTLIKQPDNPYVYGVKWDGEWQVTYDTFRDMGIAYAVGLLLIYLLVVAQFRSYLVPLIIMVPIPLTVIGVLPGHALLGAQFTATSMIGMIVLAGIIVRNSILLVDFVNREHAGGMDFAEAVVRSGAVRAKPIILTGLAAMLGGLFILNDPIFSGLAISLVFGIAVSTLMTLIVIPVMYYVFMVNRIGKAGG